MKSDGRPGRESETTLSFLSLRSTYTADKIADRSVVDRSSSFHHDEVGPVLILYTVPDAKERAMSHYDNH